MYHGTANCSIWEGGYEPRHYEESEPSERIEIGGEITAKGEERSEEGRRRDVTTVLKIISILSLFIATEPTITHPDDA